MCSVANPSAVTLDMGRLPWLSFATLAISVTYFPPRRSLSQKAEQTHKCKLTSRGDNVRVQLEVLDRNPVLTDEAGEHQTRKHEISKNHKRTHFVQKQRHKTHL